MNNNLSRLILKFSGRDSLRTVFIVPFTLLIFATVGVTGWLSLRNGQKAVNDVATQLRSEITVHIQERLQLYLESPHLVNQLNANAIEAGQLDLQDTKNREHHFFKQLQTFTSIHSNYLGRINGDFFGNIRLPDDTIQVMLADKSTQQDLYFCKADSQGYRKQVIKKTEDFNPHTRPWYKSAIQTGKPIWSDIYADIASGELQITAAQPVWDANKQFVGVLGSSFFFTQVNDFLRSLRIGHSGQTFIIERSGLLVTTSTRSPVFVIEGQQTERIRATDSENTLTKLTSQYLEGYFGSFNRIQDNQQLEFDVDDRRQFVQVAPLRDEFGLDWLIVVVIPEADFMEQIEINTFYTIMLTFVALVLALFIGALSARQVVRPILHLNQAAKALAKGEWEQTIAIKRGDELGELARSFSSMARQLKESFETLRESENRLAQFLEAMPVGVIVRDNNNMIQYVNRKAQQLFGKESSSMTCEYSSKDYQIFITGTFQTTQSISSQMLQCDTVTRTHLEIHQEDKIIPIESWETPVFDETGKIAYIITAFQDITERKKAELERIRFTEELEKLNKAYERFVPSQFLSLLGKTSVIEVQLGDQVEKEMSILFVDIRGFTAISETMTPQENFNFINAYLEKMEPIIGEHHGFIDKYIGDAIMALFPEEADHAVQAAISILETLNEYNNSRVQKGRSPLKVGIGVHTGMLMLGTVGGKNRMDGTVISDAVNVASRVEGLTKMYGTPLLITEQTYQKLEQVTQYKIRVIDRVQVKGKSQLVTVYEVFDADSVEIIQLKTVTLDDFNQGFTLYHQQGDNDHWRHFFEKVLQVNQQDESAKIYLKRSG
ncbi:MAG: hypothetical protein BWK79_02470 [Beggiatoa sp. IS2]|nr:MAG: hypothetical protein BWK79_02470 [Beggiatoa sp. IS2]